MKVVKRCINFVKGAFAIWLVGVAIITGAMFATTSEAAKGIIKTLKEED